MTDLSQNVQTGIANNMCEPETNQCLVEVSYYNLGASTSAHNAFFSFQTFLAGFPVRIL